jgi:hypothetical protein
MTKIYKCFIASPGDTQKEREICDKVFHKINKHLGEELDFRIESKKWENDARPGFGKDGQDVINNQLLNDFQLFIGLMWTKFGTPTPRAGSGTEEEFNLAYDRYTGGKGLDLMMYFNQASVNPSELDLEQFKKVKDYKDKIAELGGLYWHYDGPDKFEETLFDHLNSFFRDQYNSKKKTIDCPLHRSISKKLADNLDDSLSLFSNQPVIWIEPVIVPSSLISNSSDENYKNRFNIKKLIESPFSTFINSPPQFGLTSLAHYLVKKAWEREETWCYINTKVIKKYDSIEKKIKRALSEVGFDTSIPNCFIIDSWDARTPRAKKLLKNICHTYPDIPIIVMKNIAENSFKDDCSDMQLNREFSNLNLMALPRSELRKVVNYYNDEKGIGDENTVLSRVINDFDVLNIHRTVQNCLTLLKVSEAEFNDSPVNRTQMIERVLFILFNLHESAEYKITPDVKDCEYVLGKFCELLMKKQEYVFEREFFISQLQSYCEQKLLPLDVNFVFDILYENNIVVLQDSVFMFRATYWIYYFAARRMFIDDKFKNYILNNEEFVTSPEIIEFYSGIDRNRKDVLLKLNDDLKQTLESINIRANLHDEIIPLGQVKWSPSPESLEEMKQVISEGVKESKLPTELKDKYADNNYNQLKPYDQSVNSILKEYEFSMLFQQVKSTSRALRNSDYVTPDVKREVLSTITKSWKQVSKILFALGPILANKGKASFEGQGFILNDGFSKSFEDRLQEIWMANPQNIIDLFKSDLFSKKLGPLLFDHLLSEDDPLVRHLMVLLLIQERPTNWKASVTPYIEALPFNSFYLADVLGNLSHVYKYDFIEDSELKEIKFLMKKVAAIHEFSGKHDLVTINRISSSIFPTREKITEEF